MGSWRRDVDSKSGVTASWEIVNGSLSRKCRLCGFTATCSKDNIHNNLEKEI